jgi:hypothetical protein
MDMCKRGIFYEGCMVEKSGDISDISEKLSGQ